MKIVYVYDAIARIGGVEKILADKMNYFADVCAYDIYLITAAQGNHPFSFPISARDKTYRSQMPAFTCNISIKLHCDGG